jgi:hypothetical protein
MGKTYNIFISHSWSHVDDLKHLRNLLNAKGYFNVEFTEVAPMHPIRSVNTYYIKQQLSERIKSSDIILGIAGIYASYSEWMEWELDKAIEHGKPILGVIPWGHERVSSVVSNKAKKIVRWNTDSIVDAIRELV